MPEMRKISELYENELSLAIYGTTCEVDDLKESISQHGLLDPLVVTEEGALISGHRRLLALRELGWEEAPCIVVKPKDKREEEILVIEYNRSRHKTTGQLRREGERLKELIGKEGTAKRNSTLNQNLLSGINGTSTVKLKNNKTGGAGRINARDEIAGQLGMSVAKWAQIDFINKCGKLGVAEIDEVIRRLDKDEITVGAAHKQIKAIVRGMEEEEEAKARAQGILNEKPKSADEEETEFNYASVIKYRQLCEEICSVLDAIFRIDDRKFFSMPWRSSRNLTKQTMEHLQELGEKIKRHDERRSYSFTPEQLAEAQRAMPSPVKRMVCEKATKTE